MRQSLFHVESGRTRLRGSWLDPVIRLLMAITGALLFSFCGDNTAPPEGRGPAGEAPVGASSKGGSPATAPAPFYNGCYRDDRNRALDIFKGWRSNMTPQLCQRLCTGHHYAGVQWYGECWCGDGVGYDLRPDSECNTPCSGDSSQMCGGGWRNSIYFIPEYVGCYTDSSTRALPVFKGYRYDMTPQKCVALCEGYGYAGVQWHGECWCGNTLGYQLRTDSECNTACNGDPTQRCGGGWRNSIYALGDPCYGCWDY
jgi:hypothetical protein